MRDRSVISLIALRNASDFNTPSPEEIQYQTCASREQVRAQNFQSKLTGSDLEYFDWCWTQCAAFGMNQYNAVEIAYYLDLRPFLVASFIKTHGLVWAERLIDRKLDHVSRGVGTAWKLQGVRYPHVVTRRLVQEHLLEWRKHSSGASVKQSKAVFQFAENLDRGNIQYLEQNPSVCAMIIDGTRFKNVFDHVAPRERQVTLEKAKGDSTHFLPPDDIMSRVSNNEVRLRGTFRR